MTTRPGEGAGGINNPPFHAWQRGMAPLMTTLSATPTPHSTEYALNAIEVRMTKAEREVHLGANLKNK